jgi:hypothetical protein
MGSSKQSVRIELLFGTSSWRRSNSTEGTGGRAHCRHEPPPLPRDRARQSRAMIAPPMAVPLAGVFESRVDPNCDGTRVAPDSTSHEPQGIDACQLHAKLLRRRLDDVHGLTAADNEGSDAQDESHTARATSLH